MKNKMKRIALTIVLGMFIVSINTFAIDPPGVDVPDSQPPITEEK